MAVLNMDTFKGMDLVHTTARIDDEMQRRLENWNLTEQGYLEKRTGVRRLGTIADGNPLRLLARYHTPSIDRLITYNELDGDLDYTTPDGAALVQISATEGSGIEWAAQYADKLYIAKSANHPSVYNGTTLTALTGKKQCTFNLFFKDREWLINSRSTSAPDSLHYSNISGSGGTDFDSANHPAANVITVGRHNGEWLTALAEFNDQLFVFKNRSTWVLYTDTNTPADWVLRNVEPSIGCVSRATVQVYENLLYFESADGVYRTDGTTFEEISAPIRNLFMSRPITNGTTYSDYSAIWNDKYILAINTLNGSSGRITLVYDLKVGGWTIWSWGDVLEIAPQGMIVVPDKNPESLYMGAFVGSGYLFKYGKLDHFVDTTGADWNYDAVVRTKLFDFGEPMTWKRMTQAAVDFNHQNSTGLFSWVYETDSDEIAPLAATIEGSDNPVNASRSLVPLPPAGWFRSIGWQIVNTDNAASYLYAVSMEIAEKAVLGKRVSA